MGWSNEGAKKKAKDACHGNEESVKRKVDLKGERERERMAALAGNVRIRWRTRSACSTHPGL